MLYQHLRVLRTGRPFSPLLPSSALPNSALPNSARKLSSGVQGALRMLGVNLSSSGKEEAVEITRSQMTKVYGATLVMSLVAGFMCMLAVESRGNESRERMMENISPEQKMLIAQQRRQLSDMKAAAQSRGWRENLDVAATATEKFMIPQHILEQREEESRSKKRLERH
jgi:hypothetical protein